MKKHNKHFKAFILFLFTAVCVGDELAEEELINIYGSEDLISIATGYKQPVSKAPAVATVIDAESIKNMGATDLDDVLEAVPGLHVSRNYQGYAPIYTFRGIYSLFNPQVLLLINGIPQTNLFTGGRNFVWGGMAVEAIERIEIIRGPGSAIYGADAFAGVINVMTKDGSAINGLEAGMRYGTFDTREAFVSYGRSWDDSSLGIVAEFQKSDGQDEVVEEDLQTFLDFVTGTDASLAPGSVSVSKENIDLRVDYRIGDLVLRAGYQGRKDIGTGAGVAQALDPFSRYSSDRVSFDVGYSIEDLVFRHLSLDLSLSYLDVSQEVDRNTLLFPPGSTGPFLDDAQNPLFGVFPNGVVGNPEVFERHTRANATFHYEAIANHDLSLGVGYYYGDLYKVEEQKNYCTDIASCAFILPRGGVVDVSDTPFVFLKEGDRKNYYIFIQDIFNIANDWELTAGLRYDSYSEFGSTVNPRVALVWSTTNRLTTKLLYGEAFRAPSFQETKTINNPATLGNPDLDPETLRSVELAFDYKPVYDLKTTFNIFYYEWDDIIQFVPDPNRGTATAQNSGKQTGYGFETEVKWQVDNNIEILGNYSWQKSTNETTNQDVANAPGQQFYLQGNWSFKKNYNFNVQVNWVMDREREQFDLRNDIDDYILVDMALRRKNVWENVELALLVKNLFAEDAREPSPNGVPRPSIPHDLPLSDRTILGEIRIHF